MKPEVCSRGSLRVWADLQLSSVSPQPLRGSQFHLSQQAHLWIMHNCCWQYVPNIFLSQEFSHSSSVPFKLTPCWSCFSCRNLQQIKWISQGFSKHWSSGWNLISNITLRWWHFGMGIPSLFYCCLFVSICHKNRWNTAVTNSKTSKVEKYTIQGLFMIQKCEIALVLRWRWSKYGLLFPKEVNNVQTGREKSGFQL